MIINIADEGSNDAYTNIHVDEEYEQGHTIEVKCVKCKEVYIKKSLIEHGGKFLCTKCLYVALIEGFENTNLGE